MVNVGFPYYNTSGPVFRWGKDMLQYEILPLVLVRQQAKCVIALCVSTVTYRRPQITLWNEN